MGPLAPTQNDSGPFKDSGPTRGHSRCCGRACGARSATWPAGAGYPIVRSPVSFAATGQPMVLGQMKRRDFITLLGGAAAAWPRAARAQPERTRGIGVLLGTTQTGPEPVPAFVQELRRLGWTEGRDVRIEYRAIAGDINRFRTYATELVGLVPDVILVQSNPGLAALQQETRTIPIVFVQVADPVGSGFIESLARPGGNTTGFTNFESSMGGKWLERRPPT